MQHCIRGLLLALCVAVTLVSATVDARPASGHSPSSGTHASHQGGPYYGGGQHTTSHGGHYAGGTVLPTRGALRESEHPKPVRSPQVRLSMPAAAPR